MSSTTGINNSEGSTASNLIFEMDLEENKSTAYLHLIVDRTPTKAWAVCWITENKNENSSRVKVESLWLRLEWAGVVNESLNHNLSEWPEEINAPSALNQKAIAKAWTKGPNLGPITKETTY